MRKADVEKYRQQLLALGQRIQNDFGRVTEEALRQTGAEPSGGLSAAPLHPADLSSDTFDHEVAIGVLENEDKLLEQIVGALDRIRAGTFGSCAACDKEIPAERLKLLPYVAHCVECAQKLETDNR